MERIKVVSDRVRGRMAVFAGSKIARASGENKAKHQMCEKRVVVQFGSNARSLRVRQKRVDVLTKAPMTSYWTCIRVSWCWNFYWTVALQRAP